MPEENQKIKISLEEPVYKGNKVSKPSEKIEPRKINLSNFDFKLNKKKEIVEEEVDDLEVDKDTWKPKFTSTIFAKYLGLLVFGIVSACVLGIGIGKVFSNPLFFLNLNLSTVLFFIIGLLLFLTSLYLIGIFFSYNYRFMLISSLILSIALSLSTQSFSNIFFFSGFTFGIFIVLIMFFIAVESDVVNQFSFRFLQAVKSSGSFTTWFTFCFMIFYVINLVTLIGSPTYKVPTGVVDSTFDFLEERSNIGFKNYSTSIADIEKSGIDISILKSFAPKAQEMTLTPKEFVTNKVNDYVRSNTVIISIIIAVNMFFIIRLLSSLVAFFSKLLTLLIFKILQFTSFFSFEKVKKEAVIVKI